MERAWKAVVAAGVGVIIHTALPGAASGAGPQDWNGCDYKRDFDQAVRACAAIIEGGRANKSDLTDAYIRRGFAYEGRNEHKAAIADFGQAIRLSPRDAVAFSNRGFSYMNAGEFDRAMADFNNAIRLRPYYANAYSGRGTVYQHKGLRELADADLDKAVRLRPDDANGYGNRAHVFNLRREFGRALADFDKAIRLRNDHAPFYVGRGDAYSGQGDAGRAMADYSEAIRLAPRAALAYAKRGSVHLGRGEFDRAIADSTEALSLNLRLELAYSVRGAAYRGKGQQERAEADLRKAQTLVPVTPKALEKPVASRVEQKLAAVETQRAPVQPMVSVQPSSGGRRAALVIGNSAYVNVQRIPNPENDAREMAAALKRLDFDVTLKQNLGSAAMRSALRDFEDKAAGADWAVVFYAGHGMQLDGKSWLIPVDAKLERATDAPDEAVELDRVLDRLRPANGLRLVMLDACRNNPFLVRMAMGKEAQRGEVSRGLARIEPQHGELVFYAARDGQTAKDGEAQHSPFTAALLGHIEEPDLELGRLVRKVTSDVLRTTGAQQEPFVYGRLPDQDFFFRAAAR